MYQSWRSLLFLHWRWDAGIVQASLPLGLRVDTFDGAAYVGLIPFFMRGVRPRFLPAVPGLSNFLELNVRTYVIGPDDRRGVWFYSLDCNQPLAVLTARALFGLPYFHACMRAHVQPSNGLVQYECRRARRAHTSQFHYGPAGALRCAQPGSIEYFLIERYVLYSSVRGRIFSAQVSHPPYPLREGNVVAWDSEPLRLAGFDPGGQPPDHRVLSPGVDVRIYAIRSLGGDFQ